MSSAKQLFLPGMSETESCPDSSQRNDTLFLAIIVAPNADMEIYPLGGHQKRKHELGGVQITRDHLHITLFYFGKFWELPPTTVPKICAPSAMIAAVTPPFEVRFDRVGSFKGKPGNNPFVLRDKEGNAALRAFRKRLAVALAGCGIKWEGSGFTPHVTLLYDERLIPEEPVGSIRWTVSEFVLIHSHFGHALHDVLGRWRLCG
jgi:2'-5' RNA ligase